jgi:hypothetical protein
VSTAEGRYRAAAHEAGHALAAHLLDRSVRAVMILGDGGRCDLAPGRTSWRWSDAVEEAIVCLAGPLAAERIPAPAALEVPVAARAEEVVEAAVKAIGPGNPFDPVFDDRTLAERLIGGVASGDEEAAALMCVAECRARAMVEDDRFRLLIQHLTELLFNEGQMAGASVRVEIERLDWRLRLAAENRAADEGTEASELFE